MSACARCGEDPAAGFATIGDDRYCHGDWDPTPTCYMRSQWVLSSAYRLRAMTRDDSQNEPPDFPVDDGVDA